MKFAHINIWVNFDLRANERPKKNRMGRGHQTDTHTDIATTRPIENYHDQFKIYLVNFARRFRCHGGVVLSPMVPPGLVLAIPP